MAFGGGDGRPGAPLGGDPFGGTPFGGNPFDAPPVISAPPPSQHPGHSNTLATLSVVFAFVFAPAGALLGYLGLAQIRRSGEGGRERALIGLTLSYSVIVIAVVALVIWAVTGSGPANPSVASSTPTASATSAAPSGPLVDAAALPSLLLSLDEVKTVLGDPNSGHSPVPDLGVTQTLTSPVSPPDNARFDPAKCLPALQGGTAQAYADNGYQAFYQVEMADPNGVNIVTQAVAVFADAATAVKAFFAYDDSWNACQRSATTWTQPGNPLAGVWRSNNSVNVDLQSMTSWGPYNIAVNRTLGVRNNVIVDVNAILESGITGSVNYTIGRTIQERICALNPRVTCLPPG